MIFPSIAAHLHALSAVELTAVAGLTAAVLGLAKAYIEKVSKPGSSLHDSNLRNTAVLVAAGLICLDEFAPSVFMVFATAVAVGVGAAGGYHVITSSKSGSSADAVPGLEPVALIAPTAPAPDPVTEAPTAS